MNQICLWVSISSTNIGSLNYGYLKNYYLNIYWNYLNYQYGIYNNSSVWVCVIILIFIKESLEDKVLFVTKKKKNKIWFSKGVNYKNIIHVY